MIPDQTAPKEQSYQSSYYLQCGLLKYKRMREQASIVVDGGKRVKMKL